ncbi:MAG: hypothetical protein RTU30_01445 [Candidatus Thorarchaeota archaeon]
MYTKEDAERDLHEIFYKLDLDDVLGKRPEATIIDQFEETEQPNHLEHWWGVRDGNLLIAMWAPDYRLGVQYVAANLASVSVRDSKQHPVINNLRLFTLGMLVLPYILLSLGIIISGILGVAIGLLGVAVYVYGGWIVFTSVRKARQRLMQILQGLDLNYRPNQIEEYSKILRDDYLICFICGGMNFFFQLILLTMLLVLGLAQLR